MQKRQKGKKVKKKTTRQKGKNAKRQKTKNTSRQKDKKVKKTGGPKGPHVLRRSQSKGAIGPQSSSYLYISKVFFLGFLCRENQHSGILVHKYNGTKRSIKMCTLCKSKDSRSDLVMYTVSYN